MDIRVLRVEGSLGDVRKEKAIDDSQIRIASMENSGRLPAQKIALVTGGGRGLVRRRAPAGPRGGVAVAVADLTSRGRHDRSHDHGPAASPRPIG